MDLSALIFVALAVAWAVYLVPKALKHHEESESTRTIEGFSDRLRVLARREPVDRSQSRLVVPGARSASSSNSSSSAASSPPPAPAGPAAPARRSAAARRRRVLGVLTAAVAVVGVLAATAVLAWAWIVLPLVVLVAWLVACRLMVRRERSTRLAPPRQGAATRPSYADVQDDETGPIDQVDVAAPAVGEDADDVPMWDPTEESVAIDPDTGAPVAWDPVPVTLPTYVAKEPAARRTVRTIDLDSTGVWTSGPHAADSAIARQADEDERSARAARREQDAADAARRASGS